MKKFWIVLLSLLLSLACVMGFAACDETPPDDETGGTVQPDDPSGPDDPGKPHEHDFGEWTVTIPATCTEEGEEQRTCSCGETETRPIAAKGHTEVIDAAVASTCTETGLTEGKHCSVCNEVLVEQEVLQTIPHNYVNGVCTRCGGTIAATDDSYFIFTELEDGTYSVAWDRKTELPSQIFLPREHNDAPVTEIKEAAFEDCDDLTSIIIPGSVTAIGEAAFSGCSNLKSITVPDSVTSIGDEAFLGCNSVCEKENDVFYVERWVVDCEANVTSISIRSDTIGIAYSAFSDCNNLTNVMIPDSVIFIGNDAFEGCDNIKSATMPTLAIDFIPQNNLETVVLTGGTEIGDEAFKACSSLTNIVISDSITVIGKSAFYRCSNLKSVTVGNGVTFIGNDAFEGCDNIESATMPTLAIDFIPQNNLETVVLTGGTEIGDEAFKACSSLTNIVISDSITVIGKSAFYRCSNLKSVTVGNGVTSIGEDAFYLCGNLTSVYITDIASWCAIDFISSRSNPLLYAENLYLNGERMTDLIIPDGVTSIGNYAFSKYDSLMSIEIPDGVTSIGDFAFYWCDSLASVTLPDSVISIGDDAFNSCPLTSVTLPNRVTSIGELAFCGCDGLTSITIPDSVTSIGDGAFASCNNLSSFVVSSGNRAYHSAGNCLIETESKILIAGYKNSVIPDDGSVTSIGDYAFLGCNGLTRITIPDSVTSIGYAAFNGCISLTHITIPDSVTSIGSQAFVNCQNLSSITIPDSVILIGEYAFVDCIGLTSVTIGDGVTSIGEGAFSSCFGLTSVVFENPNGWIAGITTLSVMSLSDPATAAKYLSDTYYRDAWTRA